MAEALVIAILWELRVQPGPPRPAFNKGINFSAKLLLKLPSLLGASISASAVIEAGWASFSALLAVVAVTITLELWHRAPA